MATNQGQSGFILQSTVDTAFQAALGLQRVAAHKLACNLLNAHQATAASNIFRTAHSLSKKVGAHLAAPSAAGPSAARTAPTVPTGVG